MVMAASAPRTASAGEGAIAALSAKGSVLSGERFQTVTS